MSERVIFPRSYLPEKDVNMQPVHRPVKSLTGNGSIDVGAWLKIIPVINLVTLTFSVKQTKRMQGNLNLNSIQA